MLKPMLPVLLLATLLRSPRAILFLLFAVSCPSKVSARGRLMEPPQRSSLFSRGFDSPENYDDSALNCGGFWRQNELNGGRCGVCGDPYDAIVRENEPGGKYANGIIANTYTTNDSSILVVVDIQSFLNGYFEFRICPHNNIDVSVEQSCLDKFPLRIWDLVDNQPRYRYYPKGVGLHRLRVELPRGMTCTQCVLQWKWHTGTNWGRCPDGLYKTGCGPQEEYYNCADIAIVPASDLEYKHFFPILPNIPSEEQNRVSPSDQPAVSWESVSFVSHDAKTVVDLNQNNIGGVPVVTDKTVEPNVPQDSIPVSFLPMEVSEVRFEEPVKPKFDFYDSVKTTATAAKANVAETITEKIVPVEINNQITTLETSIPSKPKKDVVVLPFNGVSETIDNSTVMDVTPETKSTDSLQSNDSMTTTIDLLQDSSTKGVTVGKTVGETVVDMSTVETEQVSHPRPTVPSFASVSTDGTTGITKEAITRNFDIRTFTGINVTTPNMADNFKPTVPTDGAVRGTSLRNSNPTTQSATQPVNEVTTDTQSTVTDSDINGSHTTQTPLPVSFRARRSTRVLSRHTRQVVPSRGPPPPPPAQGAPGTGPIQQPVNQDPSPSARYDPVRAAPTLAQKDVIMQQQYATGRSMSEARSASMRLSNEMVGVEALGEPGGPSGSQSGVAANPAFAASPDPYRPPDSAAAGGVAVAAAPNQGLPQGVAPSARTQQPLVDTGMGMDPTADSGVPYVAPKIPRPPEISAAELEASIAETPIISSAVSDTGKPMDASSILGTTYIAGLNEAASNLAETSTASRQGTMIVHAELASPADRGKKGGSVEYLSPTQGTSVSDKPSETVAQIPKTQFSTSLGFMPTPEQIMSGMRGMTRPQPADTTNLEPTGPAPPDPNAQNVLEAKENLIRQLGEAMGIITGSPQQQVPDTPPPQTAQMVPDQNIATILAMAGGGSQTSAGPISASAETMAMNQAQQPVESMLTDMSQTAALQQPQQEAQTMLADSLQSQSQQSLSAEQSMIQQPANQVNLMDARTGTEMIPGLVGRPAGQMGGMTPEMMQLLARLESQQMATNQDMMMQGFGSLGAQMTMTPNLFSGMDGMFGTGMTFDGSVLGAETGAAPEQKTPIGQDAIHPGAKGQPAARQPMGPDTVLPGSDASATRQTMGPDTVIPGSEVPKIPIGPDVMIPGSGAPDIKTPIGPDIMPKPAVDTSAQAQKGSAEITAIYSEPQAATNAVGEKAMDLSSANANIVIDKTMLQNLMQMRLSPEMVNYIKFGGQGFDMMGISGQMLGNNKEGMTQTANNPATKSNQQPSEQAMGNLNNMPQQVNTVSDKSLREMSISQQVTRQSIESAGGQAQANMAGMNQMLGNVPANVAAVNAETTLSREQSDLNVASQQRNQQPRVAEPATTETKPTSFMMDMGRLFSGRTGELGGRLMGGTSNADMSWVKYETANKATGQSETTPTSGLTDTSQTSSVMDTSSVDQAAIKTDPGLGSGSMFAGFGNQMMGTFRLGGMGQATGQSSVMSEVVSGSADTTATSGQETAMSRKGEAGIGANIVDTSASANVLSVAGGEKPIQSLPDSQSQADSGFTPIGVLGSGTQPSWSFAGVNIAADMQSEKQWTWDPNQQAWVLIAPQDAPAVSQVETAVQPVQTQADMASSQPTQEQITFNQQVASAGVGAEGQPMTDTTGVQQPVDAASQGNQALTLAGMQWNAATNSYVPSSPSGTAESQVDVTAAQTTNIQNAIDSTAKQVALGEPGATVQQPVTASESQTSTDAASSQTASQAGQTWAEAGFTWDAATNAYVPTATLQQTGASASLATGADGAASAVETETMLSGVSDTGVDMSVRGEVQISGSAQMSAASGAESQPVDSQPPLQVQPTVYEQPAQTIQQQAVGVSAAQGPSQQGNEVLLSQQTMMQQGTQLSQQVTGQTQVADTTTYQGSAQVDQQQMTGPIQQVDATVYQGTAQIGLQQMPGQAQQADTTVYQSQAQVGQQQVTNKAQQTDASIYQSATQVDQQQIAGQAQQAEGTAYQGMTQAGQQQMTGEIQQADATSYQGGIVQVDQQETAVQAEGFQAAQQIDPSQRAPVFEKPVDISQSRDQSFQQNQQVPAAVTGPLMTEAQQWEQQAGAQQAMSMQQQSGMSGTAQMAATQQQFQAAQNTGSMIPAYQTVQQSGQVGQSMATPQQSPPQVTGAQMGTMTRTDSAQQWSQSAQVQGSQQVAVPENVPAETSFTPMGETGSGTDATAIAWQAVLAAAQAEARKAASATAPVQAKAPIVPAQAAAQPTTSWEDVVKAAMAKQAAEKQTVQSQQVQQVPAWAAGLQVQQHTNVQPAQPPAKPAPQAGTEKKPPVPIRPDPITRSFVRDMFVKQMEEGRRSGTPVNPLTILIGLTPELLMKSGVNPRIAKSGDVSKIVPAVERALGISLRQGRGRGDMGRAGPDSSMSGTFADPMDTFGGRPRDRGRRGRRGRRPPSARERAMQRRRFMMEQRMMTELMGMLGLGPEPLEPGDPGYRPPRGGRGGAAGGGAGGMMDPAGGTGAGMGGGMAGMPGMGGAGGQSAIPPQTRMMMDLLGL